MDLKQWSATLSRIGPHYFDDLDDLLAAFAPRQATPGRDVFPLPEAVLMPQAALKRADGVCIGVRASATTPAPRIAPCASPRSRSSATCRSWC